MKWLLILFISGLATFAIVKKTAKGKNSSTKASESFAVLELFTSEGCSSCPPADRLLPQLATEDPNIVPLSFHVDYWNRLGWTDPFSKAEFSQRQQDYARQFRIESVYTPQLIINGEYELVGSNRSAAETDIKRALKEKAAVEVTIDHVQKDNDKLTVDCTLTGALDQTILSAALVQKHAQMKVSAGENNGAKLSHANVVRSFVQEQAHDKMKVQLQIPKDLTDDNSQIIVYTQRLKDLVITGVAASETRQ